MDLKLLSLNIGLPRVTEWSGKSVETSMLKTPVDELVVRELNVDGDRFADPRFHGTPDSVLYAFGRDAIESYIKILYRKSLAPGELGENLTLEIFDEKEVSVGDRFQIGDVLAEATFPRVPCTKLNFRMQHPLGQKAMIECGRSGVYFRIIKPGMIRRGDTFQRVSRAAVPFSIFDVYAIVTGAAKLTAADLDRAQKNGAFPTARLERWEKQPTS